MFGVPDGTRTRTTLIENQVALSTLHTGTKLATPMGFEPTISCVTGRRFRPTKLWSQKIKKQTGVLLRQKGVESLVSDLALPTTRRATFATSRIAYTDGPIPAPAHYRMAASKPTDLSAATKVACREGLEPPVDIRPAVLETAALPVRRSTQ